MKYATRKDLQAAVVELLIGSLRNAPEELDSVVYYLVRVYDYDEQTLRRIIREVQPEEEGKMMSQFAQDIERKVKSQFAQEIEREVRQNVLQEGIQQGMQQGMQEGMQEGMQQGEHKRAVETAMTLLGDGMAIDVVSRYSGLSEEEIWKLSACQAD